MKRFRTIDHCTFRNVDAPVIEIISEGTLRQTKGWKIKWKKELLTNSSGDGSIREDLEREVSERNLEPLFYIVVFYKQFFYARLCARKFYCHDK